MLSEIIMYECLNILGISLLWGFGLAVGFMAVSFVIRSIINFIHKS